MMQLRFSSLIILISILTLGKMQNCRFPGDYCMDDTVCCGGCCISNRCVNTYRPCYNHDNPCWSHYCPPGMECYLYQPDCIGCETIADCREWNHYEATPNRRN